MFNTTNGGEKCNRFDPFRVNLVGMLPHTVVISSLDIPKGYEYFRW